ncbi:MAG: hypothetical protein ACRC30_11140 [Clostridium sp.]
MGVNKRKIIILGIISIVVMVYFALLLGYEKGAENSWLIGVGLFGSLCGGGATSVAIIITLRQSQKEEKRYNINCRIEEYKKVLGELEQLYSILIEWNTYDDFDYSKIRDIILKLEIDILCTLEDEDSENLKNLRNIVIFYQPIEKVSMGELTKTGFFNEQPKLKNDFHQYKTNILEIIKRIKKEIKEMYVEKYSSHI